MAILYSIIGVIRSYIDSKLIMKIRKFPSVYSTNMVPMKVRSGPLKRVFYEGVLFCTT